MSLHNVWLIRPKPPRLPWRTGRRLFNSCQPLAETGRTVAVDEISWMAMGEPDSPAHLKVAWDNLFSAQIGLSWSFAVL